jgi:hypothetical protein
MNFLDAFDRLTNLQEEALTEKLWVTINPKGSNNYYRFYTLNDIDSQTNDIVTMLNKHVGTYKQTLHQEFFRELIDELKEISKNNPKSTHYSDPCNFTIVPEAEAKERNGNIKTLTLADRVLRQKAQIKLSELVDATPELKDKLAGRKCLIHHINGHEDANAVENMVLVPYKPNDKDDLKIANGIHSVLHVMAKDTIKPDPQPYETTLYYFDENQQLQQGICRIFIKL